MERRVIVITGVVQGVGFRPFVHQLAFEHRLAGLVRNQAGNVIIEIEGEASALDRFQEELERRPPPLARVERIHWRAVAARGETDFRITASSHDHDQPIFLMPDLAVCVDCLAECEEPADHRYGYPFINCTQCGPRLTIITGVPYDRERTTMAAFAMCAACRAEFEDPLNRRFHAQPNACPKCGPQVRALDARGCVVPEVNPITWFANLLRVGSIGAIKGVGGYHLTCDARNETVVRELRRRKGRDEKPFALMARDLETVESLCEVGPEERRLLVGPEAPIVLLRRRAGEGVADAVGPGSMLLGMMLPYTALHHLVFKRSGLPILVMTSGNRADEPIHYRDEEAVAHLAGLADGFLTHDRAIHTRCDDSVVRVIASVPQFVRRSRGYVPAPLELPWEVPEPILAVGGQLKATFALGRGHHAIVGHHLGDLDSLAGYVEFARDIERYERLFHFRPRVIVHDLHPEYASTRYALEGSTKEDIELVAVQHHHAHLASCMAENGLTDPVIGVTFDGMGLGDDGTAWGGEFLVGDYRSVRRAGHLRYVAMPGGDQAVRQTWRLAAAQLMDSGCRLASWEARMSALKLRTVRLMLERGVHVPRTSSVGRIFDAVASLIGIRDTVHFEGQAATELEALAEGLAAIGSYPFAFSGMVGDGEPIEVDTRPLIRAIVEDVHLSVPAARIARRLHDTFVDMIAAVCRRIRDAAGPSDVVLSGGVFLNALLTKSATVRLAEEGFNVHRHRLVPPNDGGLCLGQLAVAAEMLRGRAQRGS